MALYLPANLPTVAAPTTSGGQTDSTPLFLDRNLPALAVATQLAFTTQPAGAQSGTAFTTQPVVAAKDASNVTVTSFTGPVTLTIKGGTGTGGAVLDVRTVNAVAGVATFSDTSIDLSGAGYVLTASASGLTSADSTAFAVGTSYADLILLNLANSFATCVVTPASSAFTMSEATASTNGTEIATTSPNAVIGTITPAQGDGTTTLTLDTGGAIELLSRPNGTGYYNSVGAYFQISNDATRGLLFGRYKNSSLAALSYNPFASDVGNTLTLVRRGDRMLIKRDGTILATFTDPTDNTVNTDGFLMFGASGGSPLKITNFHKTTSTAGLSHGTLATTRLHTGFGDSRMAGLGPTTDAGRLIPQFIASMYGTTVTDDVTNAGKSGDKVADLVSRLSEVTGNLALARPRQSVTILIGINDLGASLDPTTVYNNLTTNVIAPLIAAGVADVVVMTVPPGGGITDPTSGVLKTYNDLIRAGGVTNHYTVCDIAALSPFNTNHAQDNATYYADGIHFTAAGNAAIVALWKTTMQTVYATPPVITPIVHVSPSSLSFSALGTGGNPANQAIAIDANGAWTAALSGTNAADFNIVSGASGSGPGSIVIGAINPATIGTYTATLTVTRGTATATVSLTETISSVTIYAQDTFVRGSDSPTSVGTTTTGGYTWNGALGSNGTITETGQHHYYTSNGSNPPSSPGPNANYIDTGHDDCTISGVVAALDANYMGILFHLSGTADYFELLISAGGTIAQLYRANPGVTQIGSDASVSVSAGDTLSVTLAGDLITPKINGTAISSLVTTQTHNPANTGCGLTVWDNTQRFGVFKVTS